MPHMSLEAQVWQEFKDCHLIWTTVLVPSYIVWTGFWPKGMRCVRNLES